MDWLRLYHSLPDSSRWLSLNDTQRAIYIELLCVASSEPEERRGSVPIPNLYRRLRRTGRQVSAAYQRLIEEALLEKEGDTLLIVGWSKLQYNSDTSRVRTRKYRERKGTSADGDVTETSQPVSRKRHSDAPEETRVDTETEETRTEELTPPSDVLRTSPPQGGGAPVTKKKPDRNKKVRAWAKDPRVLEIFETWKRAWGIKRAIVSDGRIRCIGTLLDRFDVSETDLHQSIIGWTDDDWEERAAKLANHDLTVLLRNAEYFEKGLDFWTKMDPKRRAAMLPLPLLIQSVTRWGEAHKWGLLPKLLTPYLTEDQYMLHFQTRRSTAQSDVQAFLVAAMSNGTDEHKRELAKAWCDDEAPAPETPLEDIPEEVQDLAMLWTVKPVEVVSGDA